MIISTYWLIQRETLWPAGKQNANYRETRKQKGKKKRASLAVVVIVVYFALLLI